MKILIALLLVSMTAFAKTHAPLLSEVGVAKTIYIVNQTGYQKIADDAYDNFSKWGRYKVLSKKEGADLAAVFILDPNDDQYIVMQVFSTTSPDAVFQTSERWKGIFNGPKSCIVDFRKRLESK
jgi:hypothetical protein